MLPEFFFGIVNASCQGYEDLHATNRRVHYYEESGAFTPTGKDSIIVGDDDMKEINAIVTPGDSLYGTSYNYNRVDEAVESFLSGVPD